jgi:hypothetical protein
MIPRSYRLVRLCLAVFAMCSIPWLGGCGSGGDEEKAGPTAPPYPSNLSAESPPWEVGETLIWALDERNAPVLKGLVAVEHGGGKIDAIYRQYGKEHESDPAETASMAVTGWVTSYAWFQPGATQVTQEHITGATATVEAQGLNPETGRPRLLRIDMVREGGVWKVEPGLHSEER